MSAKAPEMHQDERVVVDSNGREVLEFVGEIRNLGRTAALLDTVVEMHKSGKWRNYETALGRETWLECEFDYFLIACDASYDDVSRVLAWNRQGKELAAAMVSDEPAKRRPLEQVSTIWHSPSGESFTNRATRQGWTNIRGALRPAPVPARARTKVVHGLTMDEQARKHREELIPIKRRAELEAKVNHLLGGLSTDEIRYVRDLTASHAKGLDRIPRKGSSNTGPRTDQP